MIVFEPELTGEDNTHITKSGEGVLLLRKELEAGDGTDEMEGSQA